MDRNKDVFVNRPQQGMGIKSSSLPALVSLKKEQTKVEQEKKAEVERKKQSSYVGIWSTRGCV